MNSRDAAHPCKQLYLCKKSWQKQSRAKIKNFFVILFLKDGLIPVSLFQNKDEIIHISIEPVLFCISITLMNNQKNDLHRRISKPLNRNGSPLRCRY